jgi:hypothetical protein
MTPLMTYLAGFGLAGGAGAKAFIPVLLLGAFHYTPYFELSARFQWIADPMVMAVLGLMVLLEIVVDAHPELGGYADTVSYLPKLVAGFILCAAMVGTIDDDLTALATSGVLGGGTAAGVHWLRNQVRRPLRIGVEDLHEGVGKLASVSEAGASAAVAGTALVAPPLALLLLASMAAMALVLARAAAGRRSPCVHCGEPIRPGAMVCIHCGGDQENADLGVV